MQKLLFTLFTIILLLTGCSCADSEFLVDEETIDGQEDAAFLASSDVECNVQEQETQDSGTIFVYVCGEVSNPGVYELDSDSRVINAVTAAGGILETADDTLIWLRRLKMVSSLRFLPRRRFRSKRKIIMLTPGQLKRRLLVKG